MGNDAGPDLSELVTVFVVTIGDTLNFNECMENLASQSVKFRVEELEHIAPQSGAYQSMIDRCPTPYYVQVDEDMLLVPDAIATLVAAMSSAPPQVAIVCAPLWDVDTERSIYGVKIYRHHIMVAYPYANTFSPDMEQVGRMEADGYVLTCLPLVEYGGKA